jgi:carbonic anhydrase
MNTVIRGIADFVRRRRPGLRATFQRLAQGQEPVALLLTCSDSRIVSLELHGGWFEVATADLHVWRSAEERFIRVDEKVIAEALVRRAAVPS